MKKNYKISAEKYNILMRSINDADLTTAMDVLKSLTRQETKIVSEKKQECLTNKKMREIFGKTYNGLVFYNFDLKKWNGKSVDLSKLKNNSYEINLVKRVLEAEIKELDFELVALVTMSISDSKYVRWGRAIDNAKYDAKGHVLVGGLLWRDKVNGRVLSGGVGWQQGDFFLCDSNLREDAIRRFVRDIICCESFRTGLIGSRVL